VEIAGFRLSQVASSKEKLVDQVPDQHRDSNPRGGTYNQYDRDRDCRRELRVPMADLLHEPILRRLLDGEQRAC
jgi:hypothetical protein